MLSFFVIPVFSYDYNYGYSNDNSNSSYESSSGTKYQYDMSNPSDRNDYSIDLDAQRRDQMSINPSRNFDKDINQYGGGIYDD